MINVYTMGMKVQTDSVKMDPTNYSLSQVIMVMQHITKNKIVFIKLHGTSEMHQQARAEIWSMCTRMRTGGREQINPYHINF